MHDYLYQYGDGNNQNRENDSAHHKPMGHKAGTWPGLAGYSFIDGFKKLLPLGHRFNSEDGQEDSKEEAEAGKKPGPAAIPIFDRKKSHAETSKSTDSQDNG